MTTLQLIEQELKRLRWTYEHVVKNNKQDYSKSYEHSLKALEAIKKQMLSLEKDREILIMAHGGEVINA